MSDNIPPDILHNIFCRLSAEDVIQFKGVCRSWRQIINDPDFIKLHFKHQQLSPTNLGQLLVQNKSRIVGKLFSLSLDTFLNFNDYSQQLTIEATPVKNLTYPGLPRYTPLPMASCNGLFLLTHVNAYRMIYVLWNPLTQEVYKLPEYYPNVKLTVEISNGLGYDCVNDDFKVVRIFSSDYFFQSSVYKTLVYSLKYNSWKCIKDCIGDISWGSNHGVYMNGALYWKLRGYIIVLDLNKDYYCRFPLPFGRSLEMNYSDGNLDVVDGCLVLSCISKTYRFDGWVMKDDRGKVSWVRLFSLTCFMGNLRPLTYSKSNKHLLLLHNQQEFFWLNTQNNSAKKIQMNDLFRSISCQVWQCSLFRIGNIVGGGGKEVIGAKRKRRVKQVIAKKRLKLKMTIT